MKQQLPLSTDYNPENDVRSEGERIAQIRYGRTLVALESLRRRRPLPEVAPTPVSEVTSSHQAEVADLSAIRENRNEEDRLAQIRAQVEQEAA